MWDRVGTGGTKHSWDDAFVQVIDRVEVLDSETFEPLVTGEFREESVSPD
jgi:hypothetical protein